MGHNAAARDLAAAMREDCLGARVSRLHRLVARAYEQQLQASGITLPQIEILSYLMNAANPVRPTALAAELMVERSTLSRNLALMRAKGWITGVTTSPTGRTVSVTITSPGIDILANAASDWRRSQAQIETALGPAARSTLDHWIDSLNDASPDDAAATPTPRAGA
jgi:DNA-binding MarR family transcriptional regulator